MGPWAYVAGARCWKDFCVSNVGDVIVGISTTYFEERSLSGEWDYFIGRRVSVQTKWYK